ncbi:MAG: ABC transporter ATP-binding protein [Propionibacteriales bacterium]|nr:ABC transporter ATP-binding protein [Propionibacteriales bacterium]
MPPLSNAPTSEAYLSVQDLKVHFPTSDGIVKATDGLSFDLERGKTLGIVGESGSGKSVSSSTILGLHRGSSAKVSGHILLDGVDLLELSNEDMRKMRGRDVSMIFQDPLSAMHPYYTVGNQLIEAYRVHHKVSKKVAKARAIEMLDRVGIPNPDKRIGDFPHQFSGGMRQRAMIAMGLINDPGLLIADEPTTALDVTVQAQILDLLQDLQREFNSAVIIITHDLGVVAEMADDVLVMYAGRAVEYGPCKEILTHPEMPYTWGLLSSVPDVSGDTDARLVPIPGNPPSLLNPPTGCAFHPRCLHRDKVPGDLCSTELPPLVPGVRGGFHTKRCHLADPDRIYETEVLPEIAPDLVDEIIADSADNAEGAR